MPLHCRCVVFIMWLPEASIVGCHYAGTLGCQIEMHTGRVMCCCFVMLLFPCCCAVPVQVCITYHGTATSAAIDSSSSSDSSRILGRSLTVPIRLAIQPTIQVKSMRFLQQGLPLRNGSRDDIILSKPQQLLLQSLRESRDTAPTGAGGLAGSGGSNAAGAAAASGVLLGGSRRGGSHHIRNNSEGSVPVAGISVGPMMLLPPGTPTKAAAAAAAAAGGAGDPGAAEGMQPGHLTSIPSGVSIGAFSADDAASATAAGPSAAATGKQHGVSGRPGSSGAAAAAAAAGGSLALSSQPVLELAVRNASERYFRQVPLQCCMYLPMHWYMWLIVLVCSACDMLLNIAQDDLPLTVLFAVSSVSAGRGLAACLTVCQPTRHCLQ